MNYYFRIAIRNMIREKKHYFPLIISSCIGLISFLLVSGYVVYETGFDHGFPENENVYRVTTDIYNANELSLSIPECERGVSTFMPENYPGILAAGFITKANNPQYKIGEEIFTNENIYHASPGFLNVFSIQLILGNQSEILLNPYTAIISESAAQKYFGSSNPVGQVLFKYPAYEYVVEGVFQDIPNQSHFKVDAFLSFHDEMNLPPPVKEQWGETGFYTYLKLSDKTDADQIEEGVNLLAAENKGSYFEANNTSHHYHLQPLNDIHLHSTLKNELQTNSRAEYIYLIFIIGFLILSASGFNYVQLSISRFISSAKNTGIRKIIGATNREITRLLLTESFIIHFIVLSISLFVTWLLLPVVRNQFGLTLDVVVSDPLFWIILLTIIILNAFINGLIPSILVNRTNTLELFKLKYRAVSNRITLRQLIVITQFAIVIIIIAGIIGMTKQVNYLIQKDKGFDIENTIVVEVPQNLRKTSQRIINLEAFENDLIANSSILGISSSNSIPGDVGASNFSFRDSESDRMRKAVVVVADKNYIDNYKIDILAGENFISNSSGAEVEDCIINKACLSSLGFNNPEEILGRVLKLEDESGLQKFDAKIIGVTEDIDFSDAKSVYAPIIFINWTQDMLWGNYSIKTATSDFASLLPFIKEKFTITFPNYPFEYTILEDYYNKQFEGENQLVRIFRMLILVAILISTINLFSISWLTATTKTKEIGIRKVNGAKISEVLTLLNKDFVKWVAIAFVIATPIAYYAMNKWLESFAYKTELSWWIFALAGLLALGIALLTVSWQSWRAATRNPVEALRYE